MTDLQDTIILTDELGNELTARIILTFESEEFNKSYVVYKLDDDDNDEFHAASFDPEDGDEGSLGQIETDAEWDLVEEVLESFLEEENEETEESKMSQDYLRNVNKPFQHHIVEALKQQAKVDDIPIITDEGIHFLIQLIKIHHAKKVLEIGTAIGYSSILMALFTNAKITSIERNELLYNQAKLNVEKANLKESVHLILGDANNIKVESNDFDIIFIDAAKASYIRFFEKFSKNLKKGGLIISDNLLFRGMVAHPEEIESRNRKQLVRKIDLYNEFIVGHPDFDSYIYGIGDGISISIKK